MSVATNYGRVPTITINTCHLHLLLATKLLIKYFKFKLHYDHVTDVNNLRLFMPGVMFAVNFTRTIPFRWLAGGLLMQIEMGKEFTNQICISVYVSVLLVGICGKFFTSQCYVLTHASADTES